MDPANERKSVNFEINFQTLNWKRKHRIPPHSKKTNFKNKTDNEEAINILEEIKNSPKNMYYNKSKKYKPAKPHELNFKFDFSRFDSKCPHYPNALDDINSKIQRDRCFWKAIS